MPISSSFPALLAIVLCFSVLKSKCEDNEVLEGPLGPAITIPTGKLKPVIQKSRGGLEYYAYLGIPYASAPIQNLRFKQPFAAKPWSEEVKIANQWPSACIQYDVISEEIKGEEDCLYLNVFSPASAATQRDELLPVMVFFHGGAFMFGYSGDYGAKYLMDHNVIVVTVNYRLGSFGFLNTQGDSFAEGNMGLKDQVMALKWIQSNALYFGGEKHAVTIVGEGAGGSSVHYHILSKQSKGLFSRAISMSGTALCPWAFVRNPRKNAKKLGAMLNCPTSDMNEMVLCLQGVNATAIAEKHEQFFEWNTDPIAPFAPSVERKVKQDSFLTSTPYQIIVQGDFNTQATWMLGVVKNPCLVDAYSILLSKKLTAELNADLNNILPLTLGFRDTALDSDAVSRQINSFYFHSQPISNASAEALENMFSDRYFGYCIRQAALLHGKVQEGKPIYLYYFTYQGNQSNLNILGIDDRRGVSEGDELQYLFDLQYWFDTLNEGDNDTKFSESFVKLWTSFARTGRPESKSGEKWSPVGPQEISNEALRYYEINEKCGFVPEPNRERIQFWSALPLNEYGKELPDVFRSDYSGKIQGFSIFNKIMG